MSLDVQTRRSNHDVVDEDAGVNLSKCIVQLNTCHDTIIIIIITRGNHSLLLLLLPNIVYSYVLICTVHLSFPLDTVRAFSITYNYVLGAYPIN